MKSYDAIVLGLGGVGSAALYHLARRGARVLGVEQFGVAHDRGSSHGETRIIRKAYFEHPDYVPLLVSAYRLWDELETEWHEPLFRRAGLVLVGPERSAIIEGVRTAVRTHPSVLEVEQLTAGEARARWPMLELVESDVALYEADAGYLHVERCVSAHVELAKRTGAATVENAPVRGFRATGDGVEVQTTDATYRAARLVVCAGAWSASLLVDLAARLVVHRRVQLWLEHDDPRWNVESGAPVFGFHEPEGFFYGFPSLDGQSVKAAHHGGSRDPVSPDALDRELHEADVAPIATFAARRLRGTGTRVARHAACMYTMSPDEHFIVGTSPGSPAVAFAAGLSGHGFKLTSVLGSILSDLTLDGRTSEPIGLFSPARFANR